MKTLTIILSFLFCVGGAIATGGLDPPKQRQVESSEITGNKSAKRISEKLLTRKVLEFKQMCSVDKSKNYQKSLAWLQAQDDSLIGRDQMLEYISGIIWLDDRQKAEEVAKGIADPKLREAVLKQYLDMRQLPPNRK